MLNKLNAKGKKMRGKITTVLIMLCCEFCIVNCCAKSQVVKEKPNKPAYLKSIPPDKLKEDLDFLFKTIEEVHPNMYAYTNREEYAQVKYWLYKQIDHAMSISEFWIYVRTVVSCLKDSHTRIFRPSNFIMPQITESMREFGGRLKKLVKDDEGSETNTQYVPAPRKREYTESYSYHFFPEHNTCLMVINSFGEPDQVKQYAKHFQETFKEIREKEITNLIIDVRENRGGCGLAGDELLKYLVNKPFRQIEKIEQRLVPGFFELCEQYGLNINRIMADEYGIDLEDLKSRGDYKPGITVTGQVPFKNPHELSDRFKGSIYLLIAKPTFSAASNFAAAVKYFEIGILIGQETSGKKDHYGQILPIQLPNSGLKGQVSTAHFITVGDIKNSGGVKPDYEVRQKPQDTAKGRDTVLEFTMNLISSAAGECL
ncbi:MAG: S41 family peptidase [Planctomycetota bacterium]